jgi:hypothetical protein
MLITVKPAKHALYYFIAAFFFFTALFISSSVSAQSKLITGNVTDAQTGEPIPYATIFVILSDNSRKATSTDFDGLYHLMVPQNLHTDSIYASYVSYLTAKKPVTKTSDKINFQLSVSSKMLKAVTITPKTYINPAWAIMQNMVKHKPDNDFKKLSSYQYESYNRIQIAANNLSDKMKSRKVMKDILPLMDSLKNMAGENGTPTLPIFMSETLSDYYYQRSPEHKTEQVKRTRANGVGLEDETLISQLVGSTFQQYDFYDNFLRLAGKDFISPLTDAWKTFYNYELVDEHDKIDGKEYYKIEFKPKRSHDLAFIGVMWITHDDYAFYRIDASVTPDANLNFLNKIRIQQEMNNPEGTTAYLPSQTRIVVNISNIGTNSLGFIGKFFISNRKMEINKSYPANLFAEPVLIAADASKKDDTYWELNRHDTLTLADKKEQEMITQVKNLPIVKTYAKLTAMLINGYYKVGKISLGPYLYTASYNDIEGLALRVGGITNSAFSDKWILGSFLSYGFSDHQFKYSGSAEYILSRKPWTQVGASYTHDIVQTGYQYENFPNTLTNIFNASVRNGVISNRGPFSQNAIRAYVQRDLFTNVRGKVTLTHRTFDPLFEFTDVNPTMSRRNNSFVTSDAALEFQWTPGRRLLQSSKINRRVTVGSGNDNPIFTFRYVRGIDGGARYKPAISPDDPNPNSPRDFNFNYNKFAFNVAGKKRVGILGKGEYSLTGGYIPALLPYPLLENHRYNFNTMRFLEFTSDKFVYLNYTQHMEGLITNSIPLLKSLNVRTIGVFNILEGNLSKQNDRTAISRSLNGVPYIEAGYGLENIFKIIRVDFLHRLTHNEHITQDGPPNKFAIRVTAQFRL